MLYHRPRHHRRSEACLGSGSPAEVLGGDPGRLGAMRAVVYDEPGAAPEVRDVPEPDCPDDGVLVRVEATGVCRSDWHAWIGHDPVPLPMVPGHELAGTVAAVGP